MERYVLTERMTSLAVSRQLWPSWCVQVQKFLQQVTKQPVFVRVSIQIGLWVKDAPQRTSVELQIF